MQGKQISEDNHLTKHNLVTFKWAILYVSWNMESIPILDTTSVSLSVNTSHFIERYILSTFLEWSLLAQGRSRSLVKTLLKYSILGSLHKNSQWQSAVCSVLLSHFMCQFCSFRKADRRPTESLLRSRHCSGYFRSILGDLDTIPPREANIPAGKRDLKHNKMNPRNVKNVSQSHLKF